MNTLADRCLSGVYVFKVMFCWGERGHQTRISKCLILSSLIALFSAPRRKAQLFLKMSILENRPDMVRRNMSCNDIAKYSYKYS